MSTSAAHHVFGVRALGSPHHRRRRLALAVTLGVVALVAGMVGREQTAKAAGPMPNFQMPFPCGEVWYASTRAGHKAIDWNLLGDEDAGKPVVAAADGFAYIDEEPAGWGSYVLIDHGGGWSTLYAHLLPAGRRSGPVTAGQTVGYVGTTGSSTGEHLHWEQWKDSVKQTTLYANGVALQPATSLPGTTYQSRNCPGGGGNNNGAGEEPIDESSTGTGFQAVRPRRLLDSRVSGAPLADGGVATVQVTGGSVPGSAVAAVLNVTAVDPRNAGFLTVYPCDRNSQGTSSVNFGAGLTTPNLTVTGLSASGTVCVATSVHTDLVVDLQGWFAKGSDIQPVTPRRLIDTRDSSRLEAGDVFSFYAGSPDAAGSALNLTVTEPEADAYLSAWPCGQRWPGSSNVNVRAGETLSNLALSAQADDGTVCLYASGAMHVVVDVTARFGGTAVFRPLTPARVLDTRIGVGAAARPLGAGETLRLPLAGVGGVPTGARAVAINLTVTETAGAGFVVAYPCGSSVPLASNLNFGPGESRANLVVSGLDSAGALCVHTPVGTHLVADVQGWFTAS